MLHALEASVPIFELTDPGLRRALDEGGVGIRNQFFEYLELARNRGPEHRKQLAELIRLRYAQRKIDFVITLSPEALDFALNEGRLVFPEAPILALYLPDKPEQQETGGRVIRQVVLPDFAGTMEIALKLVPRAVRVYVVNGAHPLDKWFENKTREDFKKWEGRLEFRYLSDLPLEEILAAVSSAPPQTIVFFFGMAADVTGRNFTSREVSRELGNVSKNPVFGHIDVMLDHGIVGGSLISFEYIGTRAGELTLDVLRGTRSMDPLPAVMDVPHLPMFDWRQLRHWKLSEGDLPQGAKVINKQLTLWDLRYYAIGALAFIVLQSFLITGLWMSKRRRRSAEERLGRAEDKYRILVESALEGIYETLPQGQFLTVNPALAKMLGYDSPEEVMSATRDIARQVWANPNERADYLRLLDLQNVARGYECEFLRKDGTKFWVSLHTRRVTGPDGQTLRYSGFIEDITGRELAERKLEERLRFEVLLSNISAGFVNVSPAEIESEVHEGLRSVTEFFDADRCSIGLFSEHGTQLVLAFEYHLPGVEPAPESLSKEQMPWYLEQLSQGKTVVVNRLEDFPPEAQNERRLCMVKGMKSLLSIPMASGGKTLGSYALVFTRSERVWPEDLVQRFRLLSDVFVNALERRRVEESLRQKTEELDRFFSINLDLLAIANTEGYFLRLNPAWEKFLGYPLGELMAKQFFDFAHPDNVESTRKAVGALISRKELMRFENRYRSKDGTYRRLEWTSALAGNLIFAGARDLTERIRADAELRQRREELAHMTRVAMMGELTTSLAHEINQPLAAIRTNAEAAQRFLAQASPDLSEVRQILDDIIRDDRRASDVVGKVRALVTKERPQEQSLDLNQIIGEVAMLIRAESLLEGLSITVELSPGVKRIRGDRIQLQQVILNLILNGVDAMRNARRDQRKIVLKTQIVDGRTVKASVTDFGTGIDENQIGRLFEPFYTTKRDGLGMGLSISQTIIKAHGGTIEAWNNPRGGATFAFTLPADQGEAA